MAQVRNVKLPLVCMLAVAVALAGCVVPPEYLESMNKDKQVEASESPDKETKLSSPEAPARKDRDLKMPPAPEFHEAAVILEMTGDEEITAVDAKSFMGSIYVAPAADDAWLVQAGLASTDLFCQSNGDAEDRFDVLTHIEDGILFVTVEHRARDAFLPGVSTESEWVDLMVFVPASVTSIILGDSYKRGGDASDMGPNINLGGWCGYGWGQAVHGIEAESLSLSATNRGLDLAALRVDDLRAETTNGRISLSDSILGEAVLASTNGRIVVEEVTVDALEIKTTNAAISTKDVDALELAISSTNGRIDVALAEGALGLVSLSTTNARIDVKAPKGDDYGYAVDAATTNARVTIDLPRFKTEKEDKTKIVGETEDFDMKTYRYVLDLSTTNADVRVA